MGLTADTLFTSRMIKQKGFLQLLPLLLTSCIRCSSSHRPPALILHEDTNMVQHFTESKTSNTGSSPRLTAVCLHIHQLP